MTDRSSPQRPRRGPGRSSSSSGGAKRPAAARTPAAEPLHPTAEPPDIQSFLHWPLGDEVQAAIAGMGIQVPTPIQRLAIGPVLEGRDAIAKAETGTGKTLAFGAPIIAKLDPARASVLALVLCPTRELAQQVASTLEVLGNAKGLKTALVVGGEPMQGQVQALQKGAQVVVGTPGRVLDLYGQRFLSFPWTEFVVLDEADEMLEIGFIDDVKKILSFTPDERQTLLFSATFPAELLALARESTRNPVEIATASGVATVKTIEQVYMRLDRDDRALGLIRLIEQSGPEDVFLVFCDRRTEVDLLMRRLQRLPFSIKALHGGYDQASRFRVMGAFRTGEVKALVATDVASRGLDVAHVTHVVNFAVPRDVSSYTHRIGRTGRAGRSGAAITIVTPESQGRWREILDAAPWEIPEIDPPGPGGPRGRPSASPPPRERAPLESTPPPPPSREQEARAPERRPAALAERAPSQDSGRSRRPQPEVPTQGARRERPRQDSAGQEPERGHARSEAAQPQRERTRREAPAGEARSERVGREAPATEPRRERARQEAPVAHARRESSRQPQPEQPQARPAQRAAPQPAAAQAGERAGAAQRPKRTISTRERLRQEREGSRGGR